MKQFRPAPFTPKRSEDVPPPPRKLGSRSSTPVQNQPSTTKKIKAFLTTESRLRTTARPKSVLLPIPGSPKRDLSRPATPGTPRRNGTQSPLPPIQPITSEMDVSNVDPEEVLVDSQKIETGDLSGDFDEALLRSINHGREDKVLVSVRVRPTSETEAWNVDTHGRSIKLHERFSKSTANPPPEFHFGEMLTGSDNKPVYNAVARSHVCAAMEGYNSVIFAYGQTASGKTFTLTGDAEQPGIIPRAMKDVFKFIRRTPDREYLLRCSYLEIYNETIHDLLSPPSSSVSQPVQIQGIGPNVVLTPLREEVVTSLKGVKEVLERGYGSRRTASTDWNERSSRSHSVFRLVIESRERGGEETGRQTPSVPATPGGSRLQARGGRSVQMSVLSLIDLAGSEKATSDKERTREGKYINTSLLTLGTVIGTLAENAAKNKNDHVPFRNSKLTRLLQPSLSGDARISVICTLNPDPSAVGESTSTLLFAQRVKKVHLSAQKKEVVDTEALIERYRKEIEDLKRRLQDKEAEAEAPTRKRRLSAKEQLDESRAMVDLNSRIKQLTKLILTSQTVDENKGDDSRPGSPIKLDFDLSPYQLQQELLSARRHIETQATQILSLEAALLSRPELPADAPEHEKDKLIAEQTKTIRELEIVVRGYEDNLGEPLRAVREDVEREWSVKCDQEVKLREEREAWAEELVRQLEKEKQARKKLEDERRALAAFVTKFDALGLGATSSPVRLKPAMPSPGGAAAIFAERRHLQQSRMGLTNDAPDSSPLRIELTGLKGQSSLLEQMPEEDWDRCEVSFDLEKVGSKKVHTHITREILIGKENNPI